MKQKQKVALKVIAAVIAVSVMGGTAVAAQSDLTFNTLPSLANEMLGRTSTTQQEILADKKVSRKEYEQAVANTIGCLREKGFTIQGPVVSEPNLLAYDFVVNDMTPEKSEAVDVAQDQCASEFLDEVEQLHLQQLTPRGAERKALKKELAACVKAATKKLAKEDTSPGELMEFIRNSGSDAAYQCRTKYDLLFTEPQ